MRGMSRAPLKRIGCLFTILLITLSLSVPSWAQQLSREQWGAIPVTVSYTAGKWTIAGRTSSVTLSETDLALTIQSGPTQWTMMSSKAGDMLVRSNSEQLGLRLADAKKISIVPYDAAFKTGC